MSTNGSTIRCSVAYATPQQQWLWDLVLEPGATLADAINAARAQAIAQGLTDVQVAAIPWDSAKVGIFGLAAKREQYLRRGDRVEIYRPLLLDPKESRRDRARRVSKPRR